MDIAIVVQGQSAINWGSWRSVARACEEHGVPALLCSDHYQGQVGAGDGALEAWGVICALAAVTSRLRLGTLVSPVTFRPAAVLGKLVTTADQVSQGRIEVGVGVGWHDNEHRLHGIPFPPLGERMTMLERQLRALHEQWSADWYAPAPVQRPHPPVVVGGSGGERSLALAARWADEYNSANLLPDEAARRRNALDVASDRAGRPRIRFSVMLPLVVASSRARAEERERAVVAKIGRPLGDAVVRGSVRDVVDLLRRYRKAGVDRVILGHQMYTDLDTIALIGSEIVPALTP